MPHVELPQTEFKVVVLGDTNVGKTSLVLRFTEGYYRENSRSPTVGAFFLTKRVQTSSGITAKVQIWDTAGQAQFRKMAPIYWRNSAAAILLCYDVSNVQSWNVALEWLKELRYDSHVLEKNIVLALVATKSDLAYSLQGVSVGAGAGDDVASGDDVSFAYGDDGDGQAQDTSSDGNTYSYSNGMLLNEEEKDYHYRQKQKQKSKKNRIVSFDQVEQVLKSFQNQPNIATSAGNTNSSSPLGTSSSSNAAVAAAAAAANAANYNQYGNGNGHILHMETSARKDENVDLLFQKVAEKVLFVREQERLVYMNHGVKYKHYGTSTSAAASTSFLDNSGGSDFDFLNLQQNGARMPSMANHQHQHHDQHHQAAVGPNNTSTSTMKASNIATGMSISDDSNYHYGQESSSSNRNSNGNGNTNGGALVSPSPQSSSPSQSPQSSPIGKSRQINFHKYDGGMNTNYNYNSNKENHYRYNNSSTSASIPMSHGLHNDQNSRKSNSKEELSNLRAQNEVSNISTGLCYGVGCGSTANFEDNDGVPMTGSSSSTCLIS